MPFDPFDQPDAYISFSIESDQERDPVVHAQTALFGLMYWNAHHTPQKPLPELPDLMKGKLVVFDTGQKCIGAEDSETLLAVAISVCERTWNKNPLVPPDAIPNEHAIHIEPDAEEKALKFLQWLREYGDITKLKIKGEEYETKG